MIGRKILILSGSSRKNGNSQLLAEAFATGAMESENEVKLITLYDKNVYDCLACDYCSKNGGKCIQNDDMSIIFETLKFYDTLVIATPVYYGSMPARLKSVIDRFYALGSKNMAIRDCYILAVSGRNDDSATDIIINYYEYLVNFMGWNNAGELCARGYEEIASIKNSNILKKAHELAKINTL